MTALSYCGHHVSRTFEYRSHATGIGHFCYVNRVLGIPPDEGKPIAIATLGLVSVLSRRMYLTKKAITYHSQSNQLCNFYINSNSLSTSVQCSSGVYAIAL